MITLNLLPITPFVIFMCLTPTNGRLILPQPNWGLVTQECHILPPLKEISSRDLGREGKEVIGRIGKEGRKTGTEEIF